MKPLLAPLIGDAPVVTVVGLCKNAGKTTALIRLMAELARETLAVTSVGRDGERIDVVTGTAKPQIPIRKGTLFATARGLLPLSRVGAELLAETNVETPLGQVAVFRARSDGRVQLAGPSAVGQLEGLKQTFRALGAQRILIDGAVGRRSPAAAGEGGCALLCAGASMGGTAEDVAAETGHVCALFAARRIGLDHESKAFALFDERGEALPLELGAEGLPRWSKLPKSGAILWVRGGVTTSMVDALCRQGSGLTLAAPDATHFLFDRVAHGRFVRIGGKLRVETPLTVAAVCANPWSAYGEALDRDTLLTALREAVPCPVVDVLGDGEKICGESD